MYLLLRFLPLYFIMVALPRVALFANRFVPSSPGGWVANPYDLLGILFATGLGLGVYVASYYTTNDVEEDPEGFDYDQLTSAQKRSHDKRLQKRSLKKRVARRAIIVGIVFALLDSLFNVAEVALIARQRGYIQSLVEPSNGDWISLATVWAFGLIPTIASFLSGWLVSSVDQVPGLGKSTSKVSIPIPAVRQAEPAQNNKAEPKENNKAKSVAVDINGMSVEQIMERYGVSQRTAYRWVAKRKGNKNVSTG